MRPAQGLDLPHVAPEIARKAVGLNIEENDGAVELRQGRRYVNATRLYIAGREACTRPEASRWPLRLKRTLDTRSDGEPSMG